jgi:hypothetical protein
MIKTKHLLNPFPEKAIPPFPCPTCCASLVSVPKGLSYDVSKDSRECCEQTGDPTDCSGVFVLRLVCSHAACREPVNCIGRYSIVEVYDEMGDANFIEILEPKFFYPPIHIFPLPEDFPERIKNPLLDSFSLFWSNPSASGNALRIALEALMDYQGVKKWIKKSNGKTAALNLHDRIQLFGKQKPEIAENLLAVKWLGNFGSHLIGMKQKHIIEAFRLFHHVILELFEKHSHELRKLAKRINKKRGPA